MEKQTNRPSNKAYGKKLAYRNIIKAVLGSRFHFTKNLTNVTTKLLKY